MGGVLSLVSRSPRSLSLCQAVVSVLVRFVAEKGCELAGELDVFLVLVLLYVLVIIRQIFAARKVVGEPFVW